MTDKNVSLKLRAAKAEIKKVMQKFDCGGLITLHNHTHTEFELVLPNWSMASFKQREDGKTQVHVKHRGQSNPGDTNATYHLLLDCADICITTQRLILHTMDALKDRGIDIEHIPTWER